MLFHLKCTACKMLHNGKKKKKKYHNVNFHNFSVNDISGSKILKLFPVLQLL